MKTSFLFLIICIIIFIILLLLLFVFSKFIRPKMLSQTVEPKKNDSVVSDYLSGTIRTISSFDYETLKKATGDFDPKNHLGRGGFGQVYLGRLEDGQMVAVKQLLIGKSEQGENQFLSEVRLITSIQHKNLVRLVGCCFEGSHRILVYEYMKNKSLDKILFGNSEIILNWKTRFQIITGVARGLQYLHEDSNLRIVHRDIKASNILLDDKFQPKISDFGLARFFPEDLAYLSTAFAGTLGYTAPEYAIRGELSEKADIYSFGVLVLEISSGRKNTDFSLTNEMQYLPEYAWRLYEKSKLTDLIDPKLQVESTTQRDVLHACHVALLCLQPQPSVRPPMSHIVAMLNSKRDEPIPPPMKPAFLDRNNNRNNHRNIPLDTSSEVFSFSPFRLGTSTYNLSPQTCNKISSPLGNS